jgi:hypothetical protein
LQYQSGYNLENRLFGYGNPYNSLVVGLALLSGLVFTILSRVGSPKRPRMYVPANKFTKFSGEIFLQCTVILALGWLFLLINGGLETPRDIIILIFSIFMPIYGLGVVVFFYKGKEKGLVYLSLIPVTGLMLYLVAAYVSITEMASFYDYVLHILTCCTLLVFFFMTAKSMLYQTTGRRAASIGYLAVIYLAAESVAYPIYSLTNGLGDITVGAIATSWLIGWGLIVFLLGYSRHLYNN